MVVEFLGNNSIQISSKRILCPVSGFDSYGTISIEDDHISALSKREAATSSDALPDSAFVLPGIIDLHCHVGSHHSIYGVDPVRILKSGTTVACSQGDAGAATIDQYVAEVMAVAPLHVKLAINLSSIGESTEEGCFSLSEWIDVAACIDAIDRHRDSVWAVSVNTSHHACPELDPRSLLKAGLKVAAETGLPILYGMRRPEDWSLADQLALLRPGDVVTYCFRKTPHCIVENGRVLECVLDARVRGVLFDVGHGCGSFDFDVAESAVRCGFLPDTISTDLQAGHVTNNIRHDLPLVMSKLRAVGMQELDIFRAVTETPAKIINEPKRGSLCAGSIADLTVLMESESACQLTDTNGNMRCGKVWTGRQLGS